jgi:hypothetical protein
VGGKETGKHAKQSIERKQEDMQNNAWNGNRKNMQNNAWKGNRKTCIRMPGKETGKHAKQCLERKQEIVKNNARKGSKKTCKTIPGRPIWNLLHSSGLEV